MRKREDGLELGAASDINAFHTKEVITCTYSDRGLLSFVSGRRVVIRQLNLPVLRGNRYYSGSSSGCFIDVILLNVVFSPPYW